MRARLIVTFVVCASSLVSAPLAQALVPTTTRSSVSSTGTEGNGNSDYPAVSQNGRWVVFESTATQLVDSDTNGLQDIFLHDSRTGATQRIDLGAGGAQADGLSDDASISGDGRWIVFESLATDLVPGTTGGHWNIYLFDRTTGTLRRISSAPSGNGGSGDSRRPRISSDGQAVVFDSAADDLILGDSGNPGHLDVFVFPTATGTLARVSVPTGLGEPNGDSLEPAVSNGGRFVAFASTASNLVSDDTTGFEDVFVRDLQAGRTSRVSVTSAGGAGAGNSVLPAISANGCQIAFDSVAENLAPGDDMTGVEKAFVRDQCAGTTEFASIGNGNPAPQGAVLALKPPAISDDGCLVGVISAALVPSGGLRAVVVRDRCLGTTSRIDISTGGDGGNLHADGVSFSAGTARYVVFHSGASNLVLNDMNAVNDVFVRDRANAAPPVADLQVTVAGRQVSADASASSDLDAGVASVSLAFGDGSAAVAGLTATHQYAQTGTFSVTATVTDLDGLTASATKSVTISDATTTPPPAGNAAKPVLTNVTLSRAAFAVVGVGKRAGVPHGSTLNVTADQSVVLTLTFERIRRGHTKKGRCSATAASGARCTLYAATGGKPAVRLKAGANHLRVTGRTSKGPLAPGRYRLTLVAASTTGATSSPQRLIVTIRSAVGTAK